MKKHENKTIISDNTFAGDIRAVIDKARATAVHSIDFVEFKRIGTQANAFLKKSNRAKIVPTMGNNSSRILRRTWSHNMAVALGNDNCGTQRNKVKPYNKQPE